MSITPKNWDAFQHYKDRAPAWIKLHRGLLDNRDYHLLDALTAKCLPLIWLLASEKDGAVPDTSELAFRLRVSEADADDIIEELMERGFLVNRDDAKTAEHGATLAQRTAKSNGFGNRHISDVVKREVWERDGGKCCQCGSTERIEYDHKHPVSKGGNSEAENIQLLCRPCNRSKRVSLATPAQLSAEPREEKRDIENIEKTEKNIGRSQKTTRPKTSEAFEEFWKEYPRRLGANPKAPAFKKFSAAVGQGADPSAIIEGARRCAAEDHDKIGTPFIPQAVKWLGDQRWADYAAAPPGPGLSDEERKLMFEKLRKPNEQRAGTDIRGAGSGACKIEGGGRQEPTAHADHQARHTGMASLGAVFREPLGIRASGDEASSAGAEPGVHDPG